MEQKYQIGNEHGSVIWDIEKILKDKDDFEIKEYDVKILAANNTFHGDERYAMSTDISKPLIVAELSENIDKLIDGNHRLQKALALGIEKIPAYFLSFEEHRRYIIDYNEKTYLDVVKYWQK